MLSVNSASSVSAAVSPEVASSLGDSLLAPPPAALAKLKAGRTTELWVAAGEIFGEEGGGETEPGPGLVDRSVAVREPVREIGCLV